MKIHPRNHFWLEIPLDKDVMDYIKSQIKLAKTNYKDHLVGHISSSLVLPDEERKLTNYIQEAAKELDYVEHTQFIMNDMWVNFQRKHEFNPVHTHAGKLSFVIWVEVPYTYEDECNSEVARGVNEAPCAGCFEFLYTTTTGVIERFTYPPTENRLLIFPASFHHLVYPFYTSDGVRVSISGNLI